MGSWEEIERFRTLVIELGLPQQDYALFGVKCPICGKTDRINKLEGPEDLEACPEDYRRLWTLFSSQDALVVCKFCHQILSFDKEKKSVASLVE